MALTTPSQSGGNMASMSHQLLPGPTPWSIAATFRQFILLPSEIQLMIWDFAAQQSRNVEVYNLDAEVSYGPGYFNCNLTMPGMLLACKAARNVGLLNKHYTIVEETHLIPSISLGYNCNKSLEDILHESSRRVKRKVYLNFKRDNFQIANDIQEIIYDSEDEDEEDEEILLNFSQEDLGKMQHCSMRTDLTCGGSLLYLGALFNLLDVVSIETFTVEVNFGWKCVCEPCKQEAIIPMSSMIQWESCLKDKIALVKQGMQDEGFVWPIEFLWKHEWDSVNVFETFTLGLIVDEDSEDEGGSDEEEEEE